MSAWLETNPLCHASFAETMYFSFEDIQASLACVVPSELIHHIYMLKGGIIALGWWLSALYALYCLKISIDEMGYKTLSTRS